VNDLPENTKSVDDMMFDEVNNIDCFNFGEQYDFCLLREVVGYCEDEPMMSSQWGLIGPMISIFQASNGQEATVGWSNSKGWCMKSAWN